MIYSGLLGSSINLIELFAEKQAIIIDYAAIHKVEGASKDIDWVIDHIKARHKMSQRNHLIKHKRYQIF